MCKSPLGGSVLTKLQTSRAASCARAAVPHPHPHTDRVVQPPEVLSSSLRIRRSFLFLCVSLTLSQFHFSQMILRPRPVAPPIHRQEEPKKRVYLKTPSQKQTYFLCLTDFPKISVIISYAIFSERIRRRPIEQFKRTNFRQWNARSDRCRRAVKGLLESL